ncbi:unnamed protein product [Sphagnum jensenii]|uniref:Disease resistance R13L4/SHOC-2-like LRR domain-containing protein n=1 Tax=Sphagnum jensenii TaxID=128206 RepID=A0ABP1BC21_9BRYO
MGNSFSHSKRKGVDVSQGPPKEREGDVMRIHGVINTPPVLSENAPSSSRQGTRVRYPVHDLNPNCTSKNPNLTIIFFHGIAYGIDDNWKQTWTTRPMDDKEECICWPQMWIPKDLNDNVKILSLSYDSNVVTSVHNDVTEIGRNLIQSLVINSRYEALWDGPVAMVAYSFGGLVLKSLVVEMHKHVYQRQGNKLDVKTHVYCEKFLKNLKGVVFYSVPHAGGTQDLSNYFKWQCQQIAKDTTPSSLLKNMESFNPKMEQLSIDFNKSIHENINIYAFVEGLPIDNEWGILVPMASAIRLSNNNNYRVEDANHLTICKPPSKDHLSYSKLLECLKIFMKEKNTPPMPPLPCYENQVVKKLEGISFKECEVLPSFFQNGSKEFHNLRLLDLTKASPNTIENFMQSQDLKNLRWLCLQECEIQKLPNNLFNCCHLQVLHLTKCKCLEFFFDILSQGPNMSMCVNMKELSPSLGKLNALLELNLLGCLNLQELPTSIGQLKALQELNLSDCSSLQKLPKSIGQLKLPTSIGQLSALQNLHLNDCSNLQELPTSIGQLKLPTSIGQLSALQNLHLSSCSNLQELPTSIGQLSALQNLHLSSCSNLQKLPASIGQLNALQNLDLKYCLSLQKLPTSIGQLSALQNLHLRGCSKLQKLPTSIGQLSALQNLHLNDCSNLQELPTSIGQLSALQNLDLNNCWSLQKLPTSIGQLNALQNLHMNDFSGLQKLPTFISQLSALQNLSSFE